MSDFLRSLSPIQWQAALAFFAIGGITTVFLFRSLSKYFDRRKRQRRLSRANEGEKKARILLSRFGYEIVDEQAPLSWYMFVRGTKKTIPLRADFIVKRGREKFIVEVKTGKVAPSPWHTETRRQLLEYSLAYPCSGVLLLDMETARLSEIQFPKSRGKKIKRSLLWFLGGFAVGIIFVVILDRP